MSEEQVMKVLRPCLRMEICKKTQVAITNIKWQDEASETDMWHRWKDLGNPSQKQTEAFTINIHTAASEYANAMGTQFKTEVVQFQDNHGNPIQRTLSIPEDTDAFLDVINIGRGGIKDERVVLSSDKGSSTF